MVEALSGAPPEDVQATFCATLVDEWVRAGVRNAVVAPGSRSTPMALALAARDEVHVHVVHDERIGAFVALGLGSLGDGPALLLCTSGTAAANFYPAVVEAGLSEIPMIVLTADRPDELRGVGAPQTIDQIELYGGHVRWFGDPGVPTAEEADSWRGVAADAWMSARGLLDPERAAGPVQLNLPFREPLVGAARELPPPNPPVGVAAEIVMDSFPLEELDRQRGVILVGGQSGVDPSDVVELHRRTDWPIIADPLSEVRQLDGVITSADALLRHDGFAADHAPDVIIRIGRPAASKVLAQWSARPDVILFQVGGPGRIDPAHNVTAVCSIPEILKIPTDGATGTTWMARWRHADERADAAIASSLTASDELSEPAVARLVAESIPDLGHLVVASSMPVRDLEWYGGRSACAFANRGANGIDGVMSTALGRALGRPDGPTFVLLGDLAFVHDSNALLGLASRDVDLRIVVVDNDGGGIFSFLPQAALLEHDRFEQLFGTPLGADVLALAAAHSIPGRTVTTRSELTDQLTTPGPWVVRVPTDRSDNVRIHDEIHSAVATAITA
jgi:2-succinyl-5-enolpyruvyl-6-hydroxy-3-cyclohexene-1-carboxylate synthase